MQNNIIMIGNDHGGYELKILLKDHLEKKGYLVQDIGSHSGELVRYPYYASLVADAVSSKTISKGILICSTGIGMSIIANKYKGVRAAVCHSTYQAKMTAAHNNSNILCLGGRCIGVYEAIDIMDTWLNTSYEGGRHDISLGLIEDAEDVNLSGNQWKPGIPDSQ